MAPARSPCRRSDNVEFLTSISAAAPPSWPWPSGKSLSTAAFHVGGRLLAMDEAGAISVLEPGGQSLAHQVGFQWRLGDRVTAAQIERLADHMARAIHSPEMKNPRRSLRALADAG